MVVLDINYEHSDINSKVIPFFCYGVFLDTSVLKIYFDGLIKLFYEKKASDEYISLINILNLLQLNNKWNKFYITPHILTEICRHIYTDYDKHSKYKEMIKVIFPILKDLREEQEVTKDKIISLVDLNNPILKIGDLSLFLSIDQIVNSSKKTAILVKDKEFKERYEFHPNVLIIDFEKTRLDLLVR